MTDAYPLRWPDGWPKTPAKERKRGVQFRRGGFSGAVPSFSAGRRDVLEELGVVGAKCTSDDCRQANSCLAAAKS